MFAVITVLAVAAPAAAQNAGDEQYRDPLGGSERKARPQSKSQSGSGNSGGGGTGGSSQSAPARTQAAPAQTEPQATETAPAASPTRLARTGSDELPLALVGIALLASGAGLLRLSSRA